MDAISQILNKRKVSIVFQPVWNYNTQTILGFEALARGPKNFRTPANMLSAAEKVGKLKQVELLCIKRALEEAQSLPETLLFINVSPNTLLQCYLEIIPIITGSKFKVVLEIKEVGMSEKQLYELVKVVRLLRKHGIKIALDDVGSGDRDFSNICELPCDYLKIDRSIIQGLTRHKNGSASHYLAAAKALVSFSNALGTNIIAEGVETTSQMEAVISAGINLVQGFYISRPKPASYWEDSLC